MVVYLSKIANIGVCLIIKIIFMQTKKKWKIQNNTHQKNYNYSYHLYPEITRSLALGIFSMPTYLFFFFFNVKSQCITWFGVSFVLEQLSFQGRLKLLLQKRSQNTVVPARCKLSCFSMDRCGGAQGSRRQEQPCACGCPGTQVCAHIPTALP